MRTQQDLTIRHMNMHLCAIWECDGDGWPLTRPSHAVPSRLTTFEVGSSARNRDAFCHFFIDDYRFERVWNTPERYIPTLLNYAGAIAPDFSMYMDMPYPMQAWNAYRSRALTLYWQDMGIEVIPTLNWSDDRSLEWLHSMPKGGTFACCNTGACRTPEATERFVTSLGRAVDIVGADTLLMYGNEVEMGIDPSVEVVWYANDNHERVVGNAGHRDRKRLK